MMKNKWALFFLFSFFILLPFNSTNGATTENGWAINIGGAGGADSVQSYGVVVGVDGYSYVTGYFSGEVDFSPGVAGGTLTSVGNFDLFVAKYNSAGGLIWAERFGGVGAAAAGFDMAIDSAGNSYVGGIYSGTVSFGATSFTSQAVGDFNGFVSKFSSNGEVMWAKVFQGPGVVSLNSISVDGSGNVYSTGNIDGVVDFDPSAGEFNMNSASGGLYLSKLDTNGDFGWAKQFAAYSDNAMFVDTDTLGNIYVTGFFDGVGVDFDPGADVVPLTRAGSFDIFISKFLSNGNLDWAKQFGGAGRDMGYSTDVDASGNVYLTGMFEQTVDFDGGGSQPALTAQGEGIYVVKLNLNGDVQWSKGMGGPGDDGGNFIKVSGGNVYTTGYFNLTSDFDPGLSLGEEFSMTSLGGTDVFVSNLNSSSGDFIWAKSFKGAGLLGHGQSIGTDNVGNVYVTGVFDGTVDFDSGAVGVTSLTSGSAGANTDGYLTKLDFTPPTLSSSTPADGSLDASLTSNLVLTFNEVMAVGTGNIVIKKVSDDTTLETIDVTSGAVTGGGTATITINPVSDLEYAIAYYINIDATAFEDLAGQSYAGISNNSTFNFQTMAQPQTSSGSIPRPRSTVTVSVGCTAGQDYSPTTGGKCTSWTAVVENNPEVKDNNTTQLENGKYNFGTILIRLGSKGESCRAWQSFFNSRGAKLVEDGICGKLTIAAAKQWQLSVGLVSDGLLGVLSRAKAQE